MDYVSIAKQLVELFPNDRHVFFHAWPNEVEFPPYWGEDIKCEHEDKAIYKNFANFVYLMHRRELFNKLSKYDVIVEFFDGTINYVYDNSGFNHPKTLWKDFDIDNPIIPQKLNKAMEIIHGKNWLSIPTRINYTSTYTIKRETSFIKPEKL